MVRLLVGWCRWERDRSSGDGPRRRIGGPDSSRGHDGRRTSQPIG
ncbi:hypothetical protein KPATCC21470_4662 [Kitasatospora purpeofusca]